MLIARLGGAASAVPELGLTATEIVLRICQAPIPQLKGFRAIDGFGESGDLMSLKLRRLLDIMRCTLPLQIGTRATIAMTGDIGTLVGM